ncbi:MAG: FtsK/SpoIIIE domain-containing protein, partial [Lachnospiraceae bacterium]|nr:FtsK/SpoIIIE domain-containing protein [Lachnospiraceae bacterium]
HGLMAGTTGSGKSEVLMTYILSMAVLYSPYEVAFLIIDFKGGGMGNQFKKLPHTLGVITDIDKNGIRRSLISIKAEIERRKRLFHDIAVNHINDYIEVWKRNKKIPVLPHLIIIVDEFAELKSQFPEFMAELNSAARVGRSLGIHLILATQKPKGQVDEQIESNTNFRLCLKVQTPEDSREVIKTPLAAEIREAGRAYMMVGNNEIFELFQSAYSGASADIKDIANQREFTVSAVDFAGRRTPIFAKKRRKLEKGEDFVSQNDAITKRIIECFEKTGLPKLPDICQPALEEKLKYVQHKKINDTGIYADLGIFDDPEQQIQELYSVNIATQHMLIIGALQTGKTNVLQLIIRNLAEKYSPDEVNFYIIDYSSMILTNFQNLAHVGGVVVPNEEEKLNNLFKLLTNEISARKQKLKSIGVSSFTAYKEAGKNDMPLILLMIDNFTMLKENSLENNPILLSILREGLSVGISVIIANGSVKGMETKYLSHFACRIGLHHNNSDEYGILFGAFRMSVEPIPGRCIVVVDKHNLECQLYQSFEGLKEIDRVNNIKSFTQEINEIYPDKKAPLIPEISESLMENDICRQYASYYDGYQIILGFNYETLMPKKINLSGLNLMVSGTPESGKGNFTRYIISRLEAVKESSPSEIIIFDKATIKKFEPESKKYSCVSRYEISPDNMAEICKEWKAELESRKQLVLANKGDMSVLKDKPLLMMICEDSGKDMLEKFDDTLFSYLPYKFAWIASSVENDDMSPMNAHKLYKAKNAGAGFMFFGAMAASKSIDKFAKFQPSEKTNRFGVEMEQGDAFYVDARDITKVYRMKTIIHQENASDKG